MSFYFFENAGEVIYVVLVIKIVVLVNIITGYSNLQIHFTQVLYLN